MKSRGKCKTCNVTNATGYYDDRCSVTGCKDGYDKKANCAACNVTNATGYSDDLCSVTGCKDGYDKAANCAACNVTNATGYVDGRLILHEGFWKGFGDTCWVTGCKVGYDKHANCAACNVTNATGYSDDLCSVTGCKVGYDKARSCAACYVTNATGYSDDDCRVTGCKDGYDLSYVQKTLGPDGRPWGMTKNILAGFCCPRFARCDLDLGDITTRIENEDICREAAEFLGKSFTEKAGVCVGKSDPSLDLYCSDSKTETSCVQTVIPHSKRRLSSTERSGIACQWAFKHSPKGCSYSEGKAVFNSHPCPPADNCGLNTQICWNDWCPARSTSSGSQAATATLEGGDHHEHGQKAPVEIVNEEAVAALESKHNADNKELTLKHDTDISEVDALKSQHNSDKEALESQMREVMQKLEAIEAAVNKPARIKPPKAPKVDCKTFNIVDCKGPSCEVKGKKNPKCVKKRGRRRILRLEKAETDEP